MIGPDIKRFYIEGAAKEIAHIERKQFDEEARLKSRMLREGYTPVLDIAPLLGVEYNAQKRTYKYAVTIYGVKVDDAWVVEGWLNGQTVPASTGTTFNRLARKADVDAAPGQSGFVRTRPHKVSS